MFFSISHKICENYTEHHRLKPFVINVDAGWTLQTVGKFTVVFKGYADGADLNQSLDTIISQREPVYTGNYCVFCYNPDNKTITVHTDRYRAFPIYVGDKEITNLVPTGRTVWTDGLIVINWNLTVNQIEFDVLGNVESSPLTRLQVVDRVTDILDQKTKQFLTHNRLPLKSYLSGGVDSLMVYSFLKKHHADTELIDYDHLEYDWFWTQNSGTLKQYWGYRQIHHWREPCILSSGAPGDEFTLRSPSICNQFLLNRGTSILEQLNLAPDCIHGNYFLLPKHVSLYKSQTATADRETLFRRLCDTVLNDWQHWHLSNTLTWTPLRDIEIFKLFLRLNLDDALGQIMNSKISIDIIENNCPGLSQVISTQKNTGNLLSNFGRYFYGTSK